MDGNSSPVSVRPSARSYQDYLNQQQRSTTRPQNEPKDLFDGPRLMRQMLIGFTCAGFAGIVMLILGTIFIAEAVGKQQPITVMLCVMGIVFGIIVIAGTVVLGRLLISRKWVKCQGRESAPSQCFHTCSVVYSPSLDQIGTAESNSDLPPAYDSVIPTSSQPLTLEGTLEQSGNFLDMSVMVLPPKYEEVAIPLPDYCDYDEKDDEGDALAITRCTSTV